MTQVFYFKPSESVLTSEQVVGQIGINPENVDKDILLSLGLYSIVEGAEVVEALDNPSPEYKCKGDYYIKCPSSLEIDLPEGKSITRAELCKRAISLIHNCSIEQGLNPDLSVFFGLIPQDGKSLSIENCKKCQREIVEKLDESLLEVEKAEKVSTLRQILNSWS